MVIEVREAEDEVALEEVVAVVVEIVDAVVAVLVEVEDVVEVAAAEAVAVVVVRVVLRQERLLSLNLIVTMESSSHVERKTLLLHEISYPDQKFMEKNEFLLRLGLIHLPSLLLSSVNVF